MSSVIVSFVGAGSLISNSSFDSGSIWAQKSRFATAYIYENYLYDTDGAVESYIILAKEYPATEQGKIALYKIKEPVLEIVKPDTVVSDTLFSTPDTSNSEQETIIPIPSQEEEEAKEQDGE